MTELIAEPGYFHSTFRVVGNRLGFTGDAWRRYFVSPPASEWEEETSGAIQYIGSDTTMSLIMGYEPTLGLSLAYSWYAPHDHTKNAQHYALSPTSSMDSGDDFVLLDDGMTAPRCSFVSFPHAWPVVDSFLRNPFEKPDCIEWVDAETLNWPDAF